MSWEELNVAALKAMEKDKLVSVVSKLIEDRNELLSRIELDKKKLELASTIARIGYYETDIRTGICNANDSFVNIFKLDKNTFTVEEFQKLVHPDDFNWVMADYADCLVTGRNFEAEYRCVDSIGEIMYVKSHSYFILDGSGAPKKIVGLKQDITAFNESKSDLVRKNRELERINQLMVDRELKMVELKAEMSKLQQELKITLAELAKK